MLGLDQNLNTAAFFECFPESCYRLFGINLKQCFGNDKVLIKEINSALDDFFLLHKEFNVLKLFLNDEILCFIINYKVSLNVNIIKMISNLSKSKRLSINDFFLVLGREFKDIKQIKKEYDEYFISHLSQHFYHKDEKLLIVDNEKKLDQRDIKFNFDEYYNLIKSHEFSSAINILNRYVQALIDNKNEEYTLKNITKNLLFNLAASTEEDEINIDKLRKEYFKRIDNTKSIDEFKEVFEDIVSYLNTDLKKTVNIDEAITREIIEYIKKHYTEHLDLKEISKVFNFNYYYLSAYFNNHFKEGFNEYLNKLRVKKACELLRNSSISVSEVSNTVGYSDHSYFCRVFKKLTGVTPSKYRRVESVKVGELSEM